MSTVQLVHGDCLEYMRGMDAGSVDAVITDPPYGVTQEHWDNTNWLASFWDVCPTKTAIITSKQPFTTDLICSNRAGFKYEIIWEKNIATGFLDANRKPLAAHENIVVFGNGRLTFNPQMIQGDTHKRGRNARRKFSNVYGTYKDLGELQSGEYYPRSVISAKNDKDRSITYASTPNKTEMHPTQKPVALMEYLIRTYTNEGQTVLDPFCGSGTTGVACVNTGRNFIGIEIETNYYNIACRRIEAAQAQLRMFI